MALGPQIRRLGRHSVIYGLGGIVSRLLAVFLLPLYTRYLDRADFGAVGMIVAMSAVLVTVLRLGISSAFFRFYFDSQEPAQRRLVVRTSFWFTMASATFGLVAGCRPRCAPRGRARRRRREPRARRVRRRVGADELRAADGAVPRRGALDRVRAREPGQHRGHGRRDRPARRRAREGRDRCHRRQLHRHARRLPRAPGGASRAARPPVLAAAAPRDEPLRHPARAGRARADRGQLQRPLLPRPSRRPRGGRALRDRRPHRVGDGAPAHRVPAGVAGVRLLDRGRRRGQADLLVRPHLSRPDRVVARARARLARALARPSAHAAAVLRGAARRAAARVRQSSPTPRTS